MLWLEWSVLSGPVSCTSLLCWAGSLESTPVCRGRRGGQRGGDRSPLCTGMFGGILPKQSSDCQTCTRAWGAGVLGLIWLTKSSLVLKKIKQHGQKYVVEPATLPISLELPPLHNPQLHVYSPFSAVPPPKALQLWSHLCLIMGTLPCALQTPPPLSHPFAVKALLPLPVTHGFLF